MKWGEKGRQWRKKKSKRIPFKEAFIMKPSQIIFKANIIIDEIRNNCKTHPFEQIT
jgi:hypothetical protein